METPENVITIFDPVSMYLYNVFPLIPKDNVITLLNVDLDDPYKSEYAKKVLDDIGTKED